MPSDKAWEAFGKALDFAKLLLVVGLIGAVGYGLFNLDAVLGFTKEAIELLKAAR